MLSRCIEIEYWMIGEDTNHGQNLFMFFLFIL